MSGGLTRNVSAVTPLGDALDGSSRPTRRAPKPAQAAPDVSGAWVCPACGRRTADAVDQARHVASELYQANLLLAELRIVAADISAALPEAEVRIDAARRMLSDEDCRRALAAMQHARRHAYEAIPEVVAGAREYNRRRINQMRAVHGRGYAR